MSLHTRETDPPDTLAERLKRLVAGDHGVLRASAGRLPALLLPLLPALLFLPVIWAPPFNHDVAAVLQWSQRWLAGEHLYSQLIDVNPPLIFVLNLLPAALAALTGVSAITAFRLCLLAFGGWCWWLALRVRDRRGEGPVLRAFLDVLPGLFLLAAGYDFGQREHLMVVGSLPYLLASARRCAGDLPRGRIAAALTAGLMFALKPYFLGIPGVVELAVLLAHRRSVAPGVPGERPSAAAGCRRPRNAVDGGPSPSMTQQGLAVALRQWLRDPVPWTMLALWLVYLACVPLLFPDYVHFVLPMVWALYVEHGFAVWDLLLQSRMGAVTCLLLPLLALAFYRPGPLSMRGGALPRLFALAALGAMASALVQHKGWSYHIVPIEMFACALGCVLAARWVDRVAGTAPALRPQHVAGALAGLFALYAISNGEAPWKEIDYPGSDVAIMARVLHRYAAGQRVLVLSPGVSPMFPALNEAGATSMSRSMDIWILQGAYQDCLANGQRYRQPAEMAPAEAFFYRSTIADFARLRPAAVLLDLDPGIPWCGSQFNFLDYFIRDPLFAATWAQYRLVAQWDRYRVYARGDR